MEIDLLRGGQRMPMLDPWPDSPYTVLVARAKKSTLPGLAGPLPDTVALGSHPLAKPDPDILLDLQPMIDAIYRRSRYERSIDYSKPLSPPLDAAETVWLENQLRTRSGRR